MEQLVEVKLLDDVLLLTCHSNMTIAEMSLVALSEYDTAHINNTPKNVQHVKVRFMYICFGARQLTVFCCATGLQGAYFKWYN